ncbi:phosphonate C-P lyase system protein PhnH [Pseudonocardia sp. NPDC049635]|uniref:phosphonate C-P lyase system protein PhnH n=1 Tax=Pseudonocardia sp. NPDC049635 TaxID=3155506 RepID=UPI0033D0307D
MTALAPLRPERTQQIFRVVFEALARPGTVQRLPAADAPPGVAPALLPVLALADLDTPVAVLHDADDGWRDAIGTATGAPAAELSDARLVAALRPLAADEPGRFATGSAAAPEAAALISLSVPALRGGPDRTLRGPGVPGTRTIAPLGTVAQLWSARRATAFPAGFDLLLVDPAGQVVGIPRSTRIEED